MGSWEFFYFEVVVLPNIEWMPIYLSLSLCNEIRMLKKITLAGSCCFLHSFVNGSFTQEMGNYPLLKTFYV